jgi:predicted RNase H-like nuclease
VHEGRTVPALLEHVRESTAITVVAIDIPIGLPDAGSRAADALARRALPGKASSVFTTLTRAAYTAETYADARAANVLATGGASAAAQAYALRTKILEVDAWLRTRPTVTVIEVHPELSFARMTSAPLLSRKKDPAGVAERRAALAAAGLTAPAWYRGSGFGEDDLLDACAAVWTAVRHARGETESLPPEPETFSDGLPAAIWV